MHALSIDIPSALQVAPLAGAWIEILFYTTQRFGHVESPPSRGRGLKFASAGWVARLSLSPPSRGAWIEMMLIDVASIISYVAPFAGGVD